MQRKHAPHHTAQHNKAQHSTAQHYTTLHYTAQHNATQHNTAANNVAPHRNKILPHHTTNPNPTLTILTLNPYPNLYPMQVPLGDRVARRIKMECKVPIEFEFQVTVVKPNPAFTVSGGGPVVTRVKAP